MTSVDRTKNRLQNKEKPTRWEADGLTDEKLLRISVPMAQMNKEGRGAGRGSGHWRKI